MAFFSLTVDTDDVALSLRDEGGQFADLLNEIVRDGSVSIAFQVEFAAALDEGGRGLLKQLLDAVVGLDRQSAATDVGGG
ncbi:hypothetical protein [Bosea sp. FBZP-16]|uniref:hypothetical protein n=1 Tax=Bosea sp. FBZP-16 TaxID=2065382 RepID=UPI000C3197A0|nr:hypothetical protein [Bosea sp. FBZP-16]